MELVRPITKGIEELEGFVSEHPAFSQAVKDRVARLRPFVSMLYDVMRDEYKTIDYPFYTAISIGQLKHRQNERRKSTKASRKHLREVGKQKEPAAKGAEDDKARDRALVELSCVVRLGKDMGKRTRIRWKRQP